MSAAATEAPLRILLSDDARAAYAGDIADVLQGRPHSFVAPAADADADLAFITRDVTGKSTKHQVFPATQLFYDTMLKAPSLRWVQLHSAGADRPIFPLLLARGVTLTTASGANASVVAQGVLAGLLSLSRHLPQLMAAQRERTWAPLIHTGMPRDLEGQTAVIVGWGPIGQQVAAVLTLLGLRIVVVRSSATPAAPGTDTVAFEDIARVLPRADWLVLACPLTDRTRNLLSAEALALLPAGAHVLNVARGEVVDEEALVVALRSGRLAGAYLDVFTHEPLAAESPLWTLPNVIATPHSAGHSDGNNGRVVKIFLDNLARFSTGQPLRNRVD
jgi:phosphoglycerate dehydrogenase-like enzyme